MILPSKHLPQDRALLTVGSRVLAQLQGPRTVSALWEEFTHSDSDDVGRLFPLSYDSFVLCLDLLYSMNAIELQDGIISRRRP